MTRFVLQYWDPKKRKYVEGWSSHDIQWAHTMMNKPYWARYTRWLVEVRFITIRTEKADKRR